MASRGSSPARTGCAARLGRRQVSLRTRLLLWTCVVLVASVLLGGVLMYWYSVRRVDIEMRAALEVGRQSILNATQDEGHMAQSAQQLGPLIAGFNGDRHLQAVLLALDGSVLARSTLMQPGKPAPRWFYRLLARPAGAVRLVPWHTGQGPPAVALVPDPNNEIAEAWGDAALTLGVLAIFCVPTGALTFWMVGQLEAVDRRRRRLEIQLEAAQEEERAELARDLHDEVGPQLFALDVDLMALQQQATGQDPQQQARLVAAQEALATIQRHVRVLLGRLRSPSSAEIGLQHALELLMSFWRTRYPAVSIELRTADELACSAEVGTCIHRIVQEGISNALRHGRPQRITVSVAPNRDWIAVEVQDDGGGLRPSSNVPGFGLAGMRERVNSLGGELQITPAGAGRGVRIAARLPAQPPA